MSRGKSSQHRFLIPDPPRLLSRKELQDATNSPLNNEPDDAAVSAKTRSQVKASTQPSSNISKKRGSLQTEERPAKVRKVNNAPILVEDATSPVKTTKSGLKKGALAPATTRERRDKTSGKKTQSLYKQFSSLITSTEHDAIAEQAAAGLGPAPKKQQGTKAPRDDIVSVEHEASSTHNGKGKKKIGKEGVVSASSPAKGNAVEQTESKQAEIPPTRKGKRVLNQVESTQAEPRATRSSLKETPKPEPQEPKEKSVPKKKKVTGNKHSVSKVEKEVPITVVDTNPKDPEEVPLKKKSKKEKAACTSPTREPVSTPSHSTPTQLPLSTSAAKVNAQGTLATTTQSPSKSPLSSARIPRPFLPEVSVVIPISHNAEKRKPVAPKTPSISEAVSSTKKGAAPALNSPKPRSKSNIELKSSSSSVVFETSSPLKQASITQFGVQLKSPQNSPAKSSLSDILEKIKSKSRTVSLPQMSQVSGSPSTANSVVADAPLQHDNNKINRDLFGLSAIPAPDAPKDVLTPVHAVLLEVPTPTHDAPVDVPTPPALPSDWDVEEEGEELLIV